MIFKSGSAIQTEQIGSELAKKLRPGDFVALYGDLGAGKTAFVRGAVSVLNPRAPVCSPTYSIVNCYGGDPRIYHFDLYRIEGEDDLYSTGYYDYVEEGAIVFCEWCEKVPSAIPENAIKVTIKGDGDSERVIEIC